MRTTTIETTSRVPEALGNLRHGAPILLYDADGREEETDIVWASGHVTPAALRTMRTEAGGLICTTLAPEVHRALGLPYLVDVLKAAARESPILARLVDAKVPYEHGASKPSFGLTINHRETFTGVTDNDRSLTIRRLADLAARVGKDPEAKIAATFASEFKAPGHVILLNAHTDLLDGRRGHTELSTALVTMAGLAPTATICEMMNGPSGRALPKRDAVKYAGRHGIAFLSGSEVVSAWQAWRHGARTPRNGSA